MANFSFLILDCYSQSAHLDLFLTSNTGICSLLALPPLWSYYHIAISVSIDFSSNSKVSVPWVFLFVAQLVIIIFPVEMVFTIIWKMFHARRYHVFKLGSSTATAAAAEFCGWVQVVIDVYILYREYQVKSYLSPWFPASCPDAIAHQNHFLYLHQKK